MTPTLMGRFQTRIFLAATIGVLWTAAITPALPRPAGMSDDFAYHVTFEALGLMTLLGLGWEVIYHALQQARWDKDWPSLFALLVVTNEAIPLWYVTHILDVIPGTTRLSSPIIPLYVIHVSTTWVLMWLFMQGPLRVLHLRWRFEGGKVLARAPGKFRRRSSWPGLPDAASAAAGVQADPDGTGPAGLASGMGAAGPQPAAAGIARPAAATAGDAGHLAQGILCRHGHFGHPATRYCVICGSAVTPLVGPTVLRPPPPAGILILPDGSTRVLDQDLAVTKPASSGGLGFLPLEESTQAAAHIKITGWQPVISSPLQAMSLFLPGGSHLQAEPHVPVPLVPGAEFTIGEHRVRFESPHRTGPLSQAPPGTAGLPPPTAVPEPVRDPHAARRGVPRNRRAAGLAAGVLVAIGALPRLAAVRTAAASRITLAWLTSKPSRAALAVAAGTAGGALVTAMLLVLIRHPVVQLGGGPQAAAGPSRSPSSAATAPGTRSPGNSHRTRPPGSGYGPGRTAPSPSYALADQPQPTPSTHPAGSTPASPLAPPPTRTPAPSPAPPPSPTGTPTPAPGACLTLPVLKTRVCVPL